MFAAYTGDLDGTIFWFDLWPIQSTTANRHATEADTKRRYGEKIAAQLAKFSDWCRSSCTAPVRILTGRELQQTMISHYDPEAVTLADVAPCLDASDLPVNILIVPCEKGDLQLGIPLPHGQKWSFAMNSTAENMVVTDFVVDLAMAVSKRQRRSTLLGTVDLVARPRF